MTGKSTSNINRSFAQNSHKQRINIRSFDFDGCLFNKAYHKGYAAALAGKIGLYDAFTKANENLFGKIGEELKDNSYEHVFYTVGSARQSIKVDEYNAIRNKTNSCFPFMEAIKYRIGKGEVEGFLLTDLYNDRPHGTSFKEAMDLIQSKRKYDSEYGWVFDESKFTILYAQMHKFAQEHSDKKIDFDFYDDRWNILVVLHDVFKSYPHLLPENLSLRMHQYQGQDITSMEPIEGKGTPDKTYARTVKEWVKAHGIRRPCGENQEFNVLKTNNQINLDKILAIRPKGSKDPIYPEVTWYNNTQNITTAFCAGIGFFATGGTGLVLGAMGGYLVSAFIDSQSEFNNRG